MRALCALVAIVGVLALPSAAAAVCGLSHSEDRGVVRSALATQIRGMQRDGWPRARGRLFACKRRAGKLSCRVAEMWSPRFGFRYTINVTCGKRRVVVWSSRFELWAR